MEKYDLIIIGAGPGGYVAAIKAKEYQKRVLLVERDKIGGTCLNRGCIPTKELIYSSQLYHDSKVKSSQYGITATAECDSVKMNQRKNESVDKLRNGIEKLLVEKKVELVKGNAKAIDAHTVEVNGEEYITEKLLIATGSAPFLPKITGINSPYVNTSDDLLNRDNFDFDSLTIIGGGVIGVEFAGIFLNLGKKVTIIEALDRLLPTSDSELSRGLKLNLTKLGAKIYLNEPVKEIRDNIVITDKQEIKSDLILCCIGRRSVNELGAQLELMTEHGCIKVNDKFETSLKDVYALGDCVGKIQLAHYASACATALIDSWYGTDENDLVNVPNCIYTDPEIAYVGKNEEQLKEEQVAYKVGKYPMGGNAKTLIESSGYGFIKVISNLDGQILGASILSERASDMINIFTLAISKKMTIKDLESIIYPHPTFGEGIKEAIEDTDKKAIHLIYR